MKNFLWTTSFLLLLTSTALSASDATLRDPMLESALRDILDLDRGVTIDDLATLEELDISGRGIHDLTGLEHATNLRILKAADNEIGDLEPLAGLSSLTNIVTEVKTLVDNVQRASEAFERFFN